MALMLGPDRAPTHNGAAIATAPQPCGATRDHGPQRRYWGAIMAVTVSVCQGAEKPQERLPGAGIIDPAYVPEWRNW